VKFLPAAKYIKMPCSCPVEFFHYTTIHRSFYYWWIPCIPKLLIIWFSYCVSDLCLMHKHAHVFHQVPITLTMKTDRVLSKPEYIKCCSTTKNSSWMFNSIDKHNVYWFLSFCVFELRDVALLYFKKLK